MHLKMSVHEWILENMWGCNWWKETQGTHAYSTIPCQCLQQYRVSLSTIRKQEQTTSCAYPSKVYSNELGLLKEDHEHLLKLTLAIFLLQILLWTKQIFLFRSSLMEFQRSGVQNLIRCSMQRGCVFWPRPCFAVWLLFVIALMCCPEICKWSLIGTKKVHRKGKEHGVVVWPVSI